MESYDSLVKALRCLQIGDDECGCSDCLYWSGLGCMDGKLCDDAAVAIEALQAEVEKWTYNATLEQSKAIANFESYCKLKEQMPKLGEWKKISSRDDGTADYECSACHGIIIDVPNDDERPLVSYCPMCGARMTVAARCKHMDKNGFCLITSDDEVLSHCIEGPCPFYEEVQDDRK